MRKFRPTLIELLVIVAIIAILAGAFLPGHRNHRRPIKEDEMFGYWIAIPYEGEAFRLFLTNGGGWLGSKEIYTNLYRISSWHVTNRAISIELTCITEPSFGSEYIRGKISETAVYGVRGGTNQSGEHWKRDIVFYREEMVLRNLKAAASIMTNSPALLEPTVK